MIKYYKFRRLYVNQSIEYFYYKVDYAKNIFFAGFTQLNFADSVKKLNRLAKIEITENEWILSQIK